MIEVSGFAYVTLDNVYTSMKLLLLGYLTPSGNMLRQSLEAACMCILLATDAPLKVRGKRDEIHFYEEYRYHKRFTRSHRAVELVKNNTDALEVNSEAIAQFVSGKQFYNEYSHPSKLTVASRLTGDDEDSWLIGGHFDEAECRSMTKNSANASISQQYFPPLSKGLYPVSGLVQCNTRSPLSAQSGLDSFTPLF